jgi:hypothetical protein
MEKDREKNYWPHFIIALVLFAVTMGGWTLKVAIDNPVELDNSYMMNYHEVDDRINELLKKQQEFEKFFSLRLVTKKINKGKNKIEFEIGGKKFEKAEVVVLLTRPDTVRYDKKIVKNITGKKFSIVVDLPKDGRWQFEVRVKIGKFEGYKKFELSTVNLS